MKNLVVDSETQERLDIYLKDNTDYSRTLISKMISNELIMVNDCVVSKASMKVRLNDKITILKELEEEMNLEAENIFLDIIYENDNVIIINKPSGMVVHPGNGNKNHTLVNALLYYTNSLSDCNGEFRPGIVHRIDKDTSGIILVCKNNKAHELLASDFQTKKVKRKYIALVKGIVQHNHVTIDAPIGRCETDRKKMAVTDKNSKHAITHATVLKRFKHYTLLECELETGRTHQIRVHMAYIGHPIYNDPLYNNAPSDAFGQFLHSSEITFTEPITKEELHFVCPLPKEFQSFLDELQNEEE